MGVREAVVLISGKWGFLILVPKPCLEEMLQTESKLLYVLALPPLI